MNKQDGFKKSKGEEGLSFLVCGCNADTGRGTTLEHTILTRNPKHKQKHIIKRVRRSS